MAATLICQPGFAAGCEFPEERILQRTIGKIRCFWNRIRPSGGGVAQNSWLGRMWVSDLPTHKEECCYRKTFSHRFSTSLRYTQPASADISWRQVSCGPLGCSPRIGLRHAVGDFPARRDGNKGQAFQNFAAILPSSLRGARNPGERRAADEPGYGKRPYRFLAELFFNRRPTRSPNRTHSAESFFGAPSDAGDIAFGGFLVELGASPRGLPRNRAEHAPGTACKI